MKIQSKNINGLFVAGLFALSTVAGIAVTMQSQEVYAAGQTCSWTGAGSDTRFSTVANWENCGGTAPATGDALSFKYGVMDEGYDSPKNRLVNDIDADFAGIVLDSSEVVSSGSYRYISISPNLSLQGGASIDKLGKYSSLSLSLGAYPDRGTLTVKGDFTGDGIAANLDIQGTYTVPGGSGYSYSSTDKMSKLIVEEGASIFFSAKSANDNLINLPIELNGGANAALAFSSYCEEWGGMGGCSKWADETVYTISGDITVNSETMIDTGDGVAVRFTGSVNNQKLLKDGLNASGIFSFGPAVPKVEETKTKLEGKLDESYTVKNKEIATLLGERSYVIVNRGGLLNGTGTVARSLSVDDGATVAPGLSPGCLTVGTLRLNGAYQFELGGNTACTQHDQIVVTGQSGVPIAVNLDSNTATLAIYGYGDFVQKIDDEFIIIDNQTDTDIQGTFKGLAEGAEVKVGEAIFTISYKGGDGNDVVLTAQNSAKLPGVPNTGIAQIVSANPVVVAVMGVLAAGALMLVRRKARQ